MTRSQPTARYTLLGYLIVAFGLVLAAIIFGVTVVTVGRFLISRGIGFPPSNTSSKWYGLALDTVMLFGWIVKRYRRRWGYSTFWTTISILLFLHLALFGVALRAMEDWRIIWFVFTWPPEIAVMLTAIDWISGKTKHNPSTRGRAE